MNVVKKIYLPFLNLDFFSDKKKFWISLIYLCLFFQFQYPEVNAEEEVRSRTKQIDGLKTALRTSTHSFVIKFIELGGLTALLDCLERMDYFTAQSSIHTSIIGCVKALMNNSVSIMDKRFTIHCNDLVNVQTFSLFMLEGAKVILWI